MKTCTWSLMNIRAKQSFWKHSFLLISINSNHENMFSQIWMQSYDVQRELAALDEVRHGNPQRAKSFDRVSIGIPTNLPIWGGPSVWRQWSKVLLQIHTVHLRGIGGTHSVFNNCLWLFADIWRLVVPRGATEFSSATTRRTMSSSSPGMLSDTLKI